MLHSDYRVKTDVRQRLLSLECEPTSVRGSVYFLRAIRPARRKPTRSPAGLTIATASTSFCCIRRFASLMGVDSETKSWASQRASRCGCGASATGHGEPSSGLPAREFPAGVDLARPERLGSDATEELHPPAGL